MSVKELREKIISKVSEVDDQMFLEELWEHLSHEKENDITLTSDEWDEIEKRDEEVKKGQYYTHEEFISLVQDRLDRYKNG